MDDTNRSNWFLRVRGLVVQADLGVTPEEAKRYERANALRKVGRGDPLTADDRAALADTKGQPLFGTPLAVYGADTTMGFVFHEAGDLVRQLDAVATLLTARFGAGPQGEAAAWAAIRAYADRAEKAALSEAEFYEVQLNAGDQDRPVTLPDGTEIKVTANAPAWGDAMGARLPEADAAVAGDLEAVARLEAERTPDDGPDGWSQIPPANRAHPLNPDNLPREGSTDAE